MSANAHRLMRYRPACVCVFILLSGHVEVDACKAPSTLATVLEELLLKKFQLLSPSPPPLFFCAQE